MNELTRAKIRDIKARVSSMLLEGSTLADLDARFVSASKFWSDACSNFDYMLALPEEYFAKLRLPHTTSQ